MLHIVKWTLIFGLVWSTDGQFSKWNCPDGSLRLMGRCYPHTYYPHPYRRGSNNIRPPEYVYLGSIAKDASKPDIKNNYYASTGPINWIVAEQNCINWFGKGSGLVSIETEEENNDLNNLLDMHHLGGAFWTGGMNDEKKGNYIWSSTKAQINGTGWSYNPWGHGEPTFSPTSKTRTILYHQNVFRWEWTTAECTASLRYICERSSASSNEKEKPIKN